MRILQLDVDQVEFELVKQETKIFEKYDEKKVTVSDALVLLTSIEKGDDSSVVGQAVAAATEFAHKQKIEVIVVYPFAHLSDSLEKPDKALELFVEMRTLFRDNGFKVVYAPFGWNKKLKLDVKGHPLAEMSRRYGASAKQAQAAEPKAKTKTGERKIDLSIVKKSDWSGLPATDHRTIGEQLDLYSFQEVSPGMVYWHPKGLVIFNEIVKFLRERLQAYGYQEVSTPALANTALWHVSGHIDHYKENMFIFDTEGADIGTKPMNCPSVILVYKSRNRSYRELPLRLSDFDKIYRNEISGALTGLFRVREITQDDAHLFVTDEHIAQEFNSLIRLVNEIYTTFGIKYAAKLSTMPEDHLGDKKLWDDAIEKLKSALESNNIKYGIKEKDGAFYGPKIDFQVIDSMGREWQCATLQLDYQLPERFGLKYVGEDGHEHTPIIIHRTIVGSLERFIGVMIEHYQGRLPAWLSPVQVRVITLSDQADKYAKKVYDAFADAGIRAELDTGNSTLEYKIREAQLMKIPYMVVVGQKEIDAGTIAVRTRSGKQKFGVKLDDFVKRLGEEIAQRKSTEMQL